MRTDDGDMDFFAVVHNEPLVPKEPQMPALPFWDEMTGELLPRDLTRAAHEKSLYKKLGVCEEIPRTQSFERTGQNHSIGTRWTEVNKRDTQMCECDSSERISCWTDWHRHVCRNTSVTRTPVVYRHRRERASRSIPLLALHEDA